MSDTASSGKRRRTGFFALRFSPGEEMQYRESLRAELRFSRTGLFLVFALGFGLAPFYQSLIFKPDAELEPFLLMLECFGVLPLTIAAAAVSFFRVPRVLAMATQSAAVIAVFMGVITLRYFALAGQMHYPVAMIGVVVIAVVFFGRFDWRRIVPLTLIVAGLSIAQEFWVQKPDSEPLVYAYVISLLVLIALLGGYNLEITSRMMWHSLVRLRGARAELRESEQRYRFMAESSPDQIWSARPDGRLDYVNEATRRYTGMVREQLMEGWLQLLHPDDVAGYLEHWKACLESGAPVEHECRLRRSDGQYRWCMVRAVLFRDESGRPHKWYGTAVDVDDLRVARAEAEAATQAKAAFLANMSHEIRTPMNAIIGMTSILLDSKQTAEQKEWTEVIRGSGEHLLTIINDILDFSKIEAGKIELESHPFSLRECVESALDLMAVGAAKKSVEVGYIMHAGVPEGVRGDSGRLRQILLNLLSNAIKFTPAQGEVSLELSSLSRNGVHEIQFSVRDSGIGMSESQQTRLFQPFAQADASTTRTHGGTGLGLSISKRLAEIMDGRIWVESRLGEGSTFSFTVRLAPADLDKRISTHGAEPVLTGRRVLIVDDMEINRRILLLYSKAWGMAPQATSNAREALDWIRRGDPYDLALLDFHMPDMDGLALASELRKLRSEKELPIVMLSSASLQRETAKAVTSSMPKPIKPARLLEVLKGLFSKTGPAKSEEVRFELPHNLGLEHPLRILIAEDNSVNQMVAKLLLNRMAYQPDFVGNGEEALTAVERQVYDIVFMDVQMPIMDGLAATRELCRRYPVGRRPCIIGMTANAMTEDRQQGELAGMTDYIVKPITPKAVVAALKRCSRLGEGDHKPD